MTRMIVGLGAVFFAVAVALGAAHLTSAGAKASADATFQPLAAAAVAVAPQPVLPDSLPATQPGDDPQPVSPDPSPTPAASQPPVADSHSPSEVQPSAGSQPQTVSASTANKPSASATVGPLEHIVQTLNNCGPASVAEVLNHWGVNKTQQELTFLRHGDPAGMNSDAVASYLPTIGMREFVANHGSQDVLKAFVRNGFPVIVSQYVSVSDPMDHFRPIEGFDDGGAYFTADDPLMGDGFRISYAQFDQIWGRYDRFFLVIFPPSKQDLVNSVIAQTGFNGPSWMTPY